MIAWWSAAALAFCPATGSPSDPFLRRAEGGRVLLMVELWTRDAPPGWTEATLAELERRRLPAMLVVPPGAPAPEFAPTLRAAAEGRHDVAVVLPGSLVPRDPTTSLRPLRSALRELERAVGEVRTAVAPVGDGTTEAMLGRAGLHSLVASNAAATPTPRMAGHFEGMPRVNVVLPPGPYADPCGADPRSAPFLPAAADRAATAIDRASGVSGTPVVRVALLGAEGAATDPEVLGRWLDEVVAPSGAAVVTAEEARQRVLEGFRRGPPESAPASAGGRWVDLAVLRAAAGALEGAVLPRSLPGDLTLAELFAGLVLVAAGRADGESIRLRPLAGPAAPARSGLSGEVEVDREALLALARELEAAWPTEIPSALPVGSRLLTAPELLVALASLATGQEPVLTRPVDVPDPHARGLGWGDAGAP